MGGGGEEHCPSVPHYSLAAKTAETRMPDWEIVVFNSTVIIVFHKVPYDARLAGGTKKLKGGNKEAFQSLETKAVSDSLKSSFTDDFGTKSIVLFRTIRPETGTVNVYFTRDHKCRCVT